MEPTLYGGDVVLFRKADYRLGLASSWAFQSDQEEDPDEEERQEVMEYEQFHCSAASHRLSLIQVLVPLRGHVVVYQDGTTFHNDSYFNSGDWNIKRVVALGGDVYPPVPAAEVRNDEMTKAILFCF